MLKYPEVPLQAGVDEAGRGCLAFGVHAAAVVLPPLPTGPADDDGSTTASRSSVVVAALAGVRDSKAMSRGRREELARVIREHALAHAVGVASVEEIDALNIRRATFLAMHRALDDVRARLRSLGSPEGRGQELDSVLVDGNAFEPYGSLPYACVPKADAAHLHVAAASILAKAHRDACVDAACAADPRLQERYDIAANKAYGTARHLAGLREHGATQHHRRSFAPVARALHVRPPLSP